jgi:hypothetical protein
MMKFWPFNKDKSNSPAQGKGPVFVEFGIAEPTTTATTENDASVSLEAPNDNNPWAGVAASGFNPADHAFETSSLTDDPDPFVLSAPTETQGDMATDWATLGPDALSAAEPLNVTANTAYQAQEPQSFEALDAAFGSLNGLSLFGNEPAQAVNPEPPTMDNTGSINPYGSPNSPEPLPSSIEALPSWLNDSADLMSAHKDAEPSKLPNDTEAPIVAQAMEPETAASSNPYDLPQPADVAPTVAEEALPSWLNNSAAAMLPNGEPEAANTNNNPYDLPQPADVAPTVAEEALPSWLNNSAAAMLPNGEPEAANTNNNPYDLPQPADVAPTVAEEALPSWLNNSVEEPLADLTPAKVLPHNETIAAEVPIHEPWTQAVPLAPLGLTALATTDFTPADAVPETGLTTMPPKQPAAFDPYNPYASGGYSGVATTPKQTSSALPANMASPVAAIPTYTVDDLPPAHSLYDHLNLLQQNTLVQQAKDTNNRLNNLVNQYFAAQ